MATKRKKLGRPTKLTPEIHDRIVSFVRKGNYIETSAAAAGIHRDTLYDWLKRGATEKSGIYKDFSDTLQKALAESEANDLELLQVHGKDTWQAIAWRLERRFPDRWGKKERIQADIKSEHTEREEIKVEQKITADPESRELLRQLFRRQMDLERRATDS